MTRDEQALVLKTVELGVEVAELRSAVKLLTNERDYLRTALAESLKPQVVTELAPRPPRFIERFKREKGNG